jgi:hypothetical protein
MVPRPYNKIFSRRPPPNRLAQPRALQAPPYLATPEAQSQTITTPGQSWRDLIEGDPLYGQGLSGIRAEGIADAAGRTAGVRSLLTQFGAVPDLQNALGALGLSGDYGKWLGEDVDDATRTAAASNEFSVQRDIEDESKDAVAQLRAVLGARGVIRSGQTGWELERERKRKERKKSQALQQLLSALAGQYGGFARNEATRLGNIGTLGQNVRQLLLQAGVNPAPASTRTLAPIPGPGWQTPPFAGAAPEPPPPPRYVVPPRGGVWFE